MSDINNAVRIHGSTEGGKPKEPKAPEDMSMDEKLTEILLTMREVQTAMAMFQSSPMSKMLGGAVFGNKK